MTFKVIYYPANGPCDIICGFASRAEAWAWVKERLTQIDWYKIEQEVCAE